jgi:hypothetical protein
VGVGDVVVGNSPNIFNFPVGTLAPGASSSGSNSANVAVFFLRCVSYDLVVVVILHFLVCYYRSAA